MKKQTANVLDLASVPYTPIIADSRAKKRAARELADMILNKPLTAAQGQLAKYARMYGLEPEDMTQKAIIILSAVIKAQSGDIDAGKFVLGLIDEAPATKNQTQLSGSVTVANVLNEIESRRAQIEAAETQEKPTTETLLGEATAAGIEVLNVESN